MAPSGDPINYMQQAQKPLSQLRVAATFDTAYACQERIADVIRGHSGTRQ
jgi:hypothetical protein